MTETSQAKDEFEETYLGPRLERADRRKERLAKSVPVVHLVNFNPPTAITAEALLLSAMLVYPKCLEDYAASLSEGDLFREDHKAILRFFQSQVLAGRPLDIGLIVEDMREAGVLKDCGGPGYVMSLLQFDPVERNAPEYFRQVQDAARKRTMTEAAMGILDGAQAGEGVDALAERAETLVVSSPLTSSVYTQSADALGAELDEELSRDVAEGGLLGISTGLANLDGHISGLIAPDLVYIAARPSVGKTALVGTIAGNAARAGVPTLLFTLEMKSTQMMMRLICAHANVDANAVKRRRLSEYDYNRFVHSKNLLRRSPLHICEKTGCTPNYLRTEIKKFIRIHGRIGLVAVDYVQLMKGDRRIKSEYEEMTEVSAALKEIAKEFNIPIIVACQLSRESEKRPDKRPILSDLRSTGQLEQDADIVLMLYREDMYDNRTDVDRSQPTLLPTEVLVRKHRNGPLGIVKLDYIGPYTLFLDQPEYTEGGF